MITITAIAAIVILVLLLAVWRLSKAGVRVSMGGWIDVTVGGKKEGEK